MERNATESTGEGIGRKLSASNSIYKPLLFKESREIIHGHEDNEAGNWGKRTKLLRLRTFRPIYLYMNILPFPDSGPLLKAQQTRGPLNPMPIFRPISLASSVSLVVVIAGFFHPLSNKNKEEEKKIRMRTASL